MPEGREVNGVVEAALPQGLFRVQCEDGKRVVASIATATRRVTVKVQPGDQVTVRLSPFDPSRGRITFRKR